MSRVSPRARLIAGVAAVGLIAGVVAYRGAGNDADDVGALLASTTDCWDEYTLTGTSVQRVIRPAGVSQSNCTVPTYCLEGFNVAGTTRNRIYSPHGSPKSFCSSPPSTTLPPTTTVTTTTLPPSTTTTSTTTSTVASTTTTTVPGPRPVQPPTRINWVGSSTFTTGVNVPWMTWPYAAGHGDFGGGATDGVVARRNAIGTGFAQLQASGTHMVRWWVFQGGAFQINRSGNGTPTSLNPAIYADFDAALALAEQYDLYYDFVLFGNSADFPSTWRTDAAQRVALANVLGPLFARYKDNPRLMSWEIFNEPEYEIWNSGGAVTEAHVKAMAVEIIKSIRLNAPKTLVTVGQALIAGYNSNQRGIAMWTDVDLDFYSPHWYNNHTSPAAICAICTTAPDLHDLYGTTKPIVIGEYQQGGIGGTSVSVARMNEWYNRGYAGAWGWSLFPENTADGIPTDHTAMTTFNASKPDIGPKTPGGPPPTTTTTAASTSTTTPATTTSTAPSTTVPSGIQFVETFDNDTGLNRFNLHVFHRNIDDLNYTGDSGGSWTGDHNTIQSDGLSCGDPSTTRPLNFNASDSQAVRRVNAFYVCRNHLMTSMGDVDNYSIVGFSPNQVFPSVRRICFDVNLTNLGNRQWWKVGVVSDALYQTTKGFQGRVPGWIMSDVDASNVSQSLATSNRLIASWSGGASAGFPGNLKIGNTNTSVSFNAGSDKATRHPACLTDNRDGTITFTVATATVTRSGAFPTGPVRVVFMDHDYTPDKSFIDGYPFDGYTWHWDNITVQ